MGELDALRVAQHQHGVLGREQARANGMTDRQIARRLATGLWQRELPGVFRVAGSPRTWRQRLVAAKLWVGRGYALSHRTAAALHGLGRYTAVEEDDREVSVSTTRHVRTPAGLVTHRVDTLSHHEVVTLDGLQVTSVTRTLLDLAKVEPPAMVRAAVDEALRKKLTDLDKLEAALERVPREPGTAFLKELIAHYRGDDGPSESELEARVVELFEEYGLPRPVRQRVVRVGNRARRIDFLVPGTNVVIEGDGYAYHSGIDVFEKDRERNNALIARGFRVLHWTWAAMHERPHELVEQLCLVLSQELSRRAA